MNSRENRRTVVIGVAVAILGVLGLTWGVSPWPRMLFDMVLFWLFCPNFNILSTSCSTGSAIDYVLPWAVLLTTVAALFFGIRGWIRAGQSDRTERH